MVCVSIKRGLNSKNKVYTVKKISGFFSETRPPFLYESKKPNKNFWDFLVKFTSMQRLYFLGVIKLIGYLFGLLFSVFRKRK